VDKFAFNVEINVDPCTLKRFTNGAACVKWLGKRLNPQRPYDGEAIVLVVKSPELEVISKFLDEFAGVSPLVPKVVVYGAEEIDLAEADSSNTLEEAIVKANALITSRAPTASVPVANASQTCSIYDVDGLVWIGEEAPFGCEGTPGRRGFASAQKAISWLERQMKLCHHPCAACTPKRRCPTCNRAYKSKAVSKQPPWVADKLQALVVAHHADALETYLSLFPQNCGPMSDVIVYSHKAEDGCLSFDEAVQTLRARADGCDVRVPFAAGRSDDVLPAEYGRGGVGYGSGDSSGASRETWSTRSGTTPASSEVASNDIERRASNDSDACSDDSFSSEMSQGRKDELDDLRALTPVPEDSELPWLFMDTIRAAQTDTLRLAGQLKLDVEDFQPGLRERLHVQPYYGSATSGAAAPVAQPSFQSASNFTVSPTPGYNGIQTGTSFTSSTSFFAGGLQPAVSQSAVLPATLTQTSSLPPSSSFALSSGYVPECQSHSPFQPGYIGNPLHPGHFSGPNNMWNDC
jgi:hypothetical protein